MGILVLSGGLGVLALAGVVGVLRQRVRAHVRALSFLDELLAGRGADGRDGSDALPATRAAAREPLLCRTLRVYFIKPSRYDDAGYVQLFWRGVLPNNTLTVLAALNERYNRQHAPPNVYVETVIWDEMVDGIITRDAIRAIREKATEDGVEVLIGLAGVQTNQYPRGRDLALQFVAEAFPVIFGGFHVSGYPPSRAFLEGCGVTTVVGEAETTWPELLADYLAGRLRPSYAVTDGIRAKTGTGAITVPLISDAALPAIDDRYLGRFTSRTMTTLDTSRGCPFTCSYCSVKNVMGRTMRARDPRGVVDWIRDAIDHHGISTLFLVDDDFYRSPGWEEILSGMAALRREGRRLSFMMQVDAEAAAYADLRPGETADHRHERSRRFVELAAAAGCYSAFIGFETFNPQNLVAATKFQNMEREDRKAAAAETARRHVVEKYRRIVANWHRAGVAVHAGYMIGFPFDGAEAGVEAAQSLIEAGVDLASFFIVTPLPGTEDHDKAVAEALIADEDFNQYDSQHVVAHHPRLSAREIVDAYRDAYRTFYTPRRLLGYLATFRGGYGLTLEARYAMVRQFCYYFYSYRHGRHPMIGGLWQRRRPEGLRAVASDDEARSHFLERGVMSAEGVAIGMPA